MMRQLLPMKCITSASYQYGRENSDGNPSPRIWSLEGYMNDSHSSREGQLCRGGLMCP